MKINKHVLVEFPNQFFALNPNNIYLLQADENRKIRLTSNSKHVVCKSQHELHSTSSNRRAVQQKIEHL